MNFGVNVKTIVTILALAVVMPAVVATAADRDGYWSYRTIHPDGPELSIDTKSNTLSIGDISYELRQCTNFDDGVCFTSNAISIALPGALDSGESTWTANGYHFRIESHSEESFFGQRVVVYAISAKKKTSEITLYYSPRRGLLAIGPVGSKGSLLLSSSYCGFAADSTCAELAQ